MRSREANHSSFTTVAHMGGTDTNQHKEPLHKLGGWRWAPLCPKMVMKRSPQDRTKSLRTGSPSPSPESRLLGALAYTLTKELSELLRPSPKNHSGSWRDGCSAVKSLQRIQIQFPAAVPGSSQAQQLQDRKSSAHAWPSGQCPHTQRHTSRHKDDNNIFFKSTMANKQGSISQQLHGIVSGGIVGPHNRGCLRALLYLACIDQTGHQTSWLA